MRCSRSLCFLWKDDVSSLGLTALESRIILIFGVYQVALRTDLCTCEQSLLYLKKSEKILDSSEKMIGCARKDRL